MHPLEVRNVDQIVMVLVGSLAKEIRWNHTTPTQSRLKQVTWHVMDKLLINKNNDVFTKRKLIESWHFYLTELYFWIQCCQTHVFMVLLEVDELLLQSFDFALQIHAAHVGVVDELPQTDDIGLHRLTDGQLGLISKQHRAGKWG